MRSFTTSASTSPKSERDERIQSLGLEGELDPAFRPEDLESVLGRLVDPGCAIATLHWGRNYLYTASWPGCSDGDLTVVVKQFRNQSLRDRLRRSLRGSKAQRSFRAARALETLGVETPRPVLYADSVALSGPSYYVCSHQGDRLEARYLLRALNAGTDERDYPEIDVSRVLATAGRLARRLHEGQVFHRDLSLGNLLIDPRCFARTEAPPKRAVDRAGSSETTEDGSIEGISVLDLNRARIGRSLSLRERMKDLSRLPLERAESRQLLLDGYWSPAPPGAVALRAGRLLYEVQRRAFLFKNQSKKGVRGVARRLADALLPRRKPHVHVPAAAAGAGRRDKVVWDSLSDQPHQHATRWEKLLVRTRDAPAHLRSLSTAAAAYPRARRRFDELERERHRQPVPWRGVGVCLRPWPGDLAAQLDAVAASGVHQWLIRLEPWQQDHRAELELARELAACGHDLAFSLPQNRELVRDPALWRRSIEAIAESFLGDATAFQIGQAPNRSKWGVWRPSEYVELFRIAAAILRQAALEEGRSIDLLGPGVIDWEPHATASYLNLADEGLQFDALASLLYVDRRGAPENRQMGLDTRAKVTMLKALAETSRNCRSGRSWITEVNWPLREGPHSPAGRDVAVSEELQASYLVRYYVEALTTGLVERIYWWRLAHKGYGLIDPGDSKYRQRPAFKALVQMQSALAGTVCLGLVGTASDSQRLYRFRRSDGSVVLVGWSIDGAESAVEIPGSISAVQSRDGEPQKNPTGRPLLTASPSYFEMT